MYDFKNYLQFNDFLDKIDHEDIYRYYYPEFKINKKISSPFRSDSNPSFIFNYKNGALLWKDFGGVGGNIISFVANLLNLSNKEAYKHIYEDYVKGSTIKPVNKQILIGLEPKKETIIQVRYRKLQKYDEEFWLKYGVNLSLLETYNVKPIDHFWINEYMFKADKHAYSYYFGDKIYKIYQPYNKSNKWFSNTNSDIIQGYSQLPEEGELLIITSSMKDLLCLTSFGYTAIAPQSESTIINSNILNSLWNRFSNIIVFMDQDISGHKAALNYPQFVSIFIPQEYNIKDISDFHKLKGSQETKLLLKRLI